uniref:Uncharacterized protein n=1 Tax=Glossina palpalis gambiensis TaxID=67801 RepID=A0A1B0BQV3_9MUSC
MEPAEDDNDDADADDDDDEDVAKSKRDLRAAFTLRVLVVTIRSRNNAKHQASGFLFYNCTTTTSSSLSWRKEKSTAQLCGAMLCCAVLCYAMLCYAVLCCAVPCYLTMDVGTCAFFQHEEKEKNSKESFGFSMTISINVFSLAFCALLHNIIIMKEIPFK